MSIIYTLKVTVISHLPVKVWWENLTIVQTSIKKKIDISKEFELVYHDNLIRRNIMDYIVAWIVAYYE